MAPLFVAVADSVFPSLDPAREVLATIGADLQLAVQPTPDEILKIAARADALLVTYAKITADMIARMTRCRIISRFGIGVDNVDLAAAAGKGIVVTKAKAFGLRVIASDPFVPPDVFARADVESVDFEDLLARSDYVSIHAPLLPETRGLFNAAVFQQMKPTAYLINTARGPIVDE